MNSRQLQYAILLAEIRNFSQVAEKLNISQPALSKQILNLEKELGVRIFDRNAAPLRLTPAGEDFVQRAKDILYAQEQLGKSMERFRTGEAGNLVIGISPFRCLYMIPEVVGKLRERFPGIRVQLREMDSDLLRKEAAEGKYDFAVVNLPVDESLLEVTLIAPEQLVLAVPEALSQGLVKGEKAVSIGDCAHLPFVTVGKTQELRKLFEQLCAMADFCPDIVAEVKGLAAAWAMVQAGVGAALLPLQLVRDMAGGENVRLLPLREQILVRQPVVITRRGQYLSEYAKYAISLLAEQK